MRRFWLILVLMLFALSGCGVDAGGRDSGEVRLITAIPTAPVTAPPATPTPDRSFLRTPVARTCSDDEIAQVLRAIPPYQPGAGAFVTVTGDQLRLDGARFEVQGVNLLPAENGIFAADIGVVGNDLARIAEAGFNTVRVFIPYGPLFRCPGHGAVAEPSAVAHLDAVLRLARAYDLRVIAVLHHHPDLTERPLYTTAGDTLAQTAYIVTRYRDDPAILAWDVRNGGDRDYALFGREVVLGWLSRTVAALRTLDTRHPVTAGWATDAEGTRDVVDIVSVQHFGPVDDLRQRVAGLRALTAKPLALVAFGASHHEAGQSEFIMKMIHAAEADSLAGWAIWATSDTLPDPSCAVVTCDELSKAYYGIWRENGTPYPVIAPLRAHLTARRKAN